MHSYEQKATLLKKQAAEVLAQPFMSLPFEPHGKLIPTGSYDFDLMVWPDLDFNLELFEPENAIQAYCDISAQLLQEPMIKHVKLIHFTQDKNPKMPVGMYMNIKTMPIEGVVWKMDIWALEPPFKLTHQTLTKTIKTNLSPQKRALIVELKTLMMNDGRVPKGGSFELYKAMFEKNIQDKSQLKAYLKGLGYAFTGDAI